MLNQRLAVARQVAAELFPAEAGIDSAIVHAAKLAIAIIEGRKSAKLPITAGQDGLALVSRAAARMVEARGEIGAAHAAFRQTQLEIGLRAVSFGDIHECPKTAFTNLDLVANIA